LPIADCRLPISNHHSSRIQIGNWKSAMFPETPKRGQGARRPDRFLAKNGYLFDRIFWE
jgi:hypothetical protein